ncbi:phosphonate ABC transporter substrate-binding protein [Frankia sp. R43]|uniref:phosphate/phosphite/phosphonate ABC transporter substrate-binding protein n=1 Tax=Frankia sp. R43 TaxID=269536 RepID=UPI0006CA0E61|nr:phosphate/phosphite/phosphonate ABC transporter substrate-binding protein [Frankia sp. R43]KPM57068.1 phosphonate ABC transporter substrate-binding protein [Frankia sp. R43]
MIVRRGAALVASAMVLVLAAACGSDDSGSKTDTAAGKVECPNGGTVQMAVEPFEDPAKLTPAFKLVGEALSRELGCKVETTVVTEYSAEVVAMRNKKIDVAVFGPLGFVFASKNANAEAVASFGDSTGKLSSYKAGIWVPKDSPITKVEELKGRNLALSSAGSTSGDAFPRYAIRTAGLQESDVNLTYAGGHPQALLALKNGKVDAAEINTQQLATATEAKEFDPSGFRQIWASDPIPNDPITVRGDLSPEFKKAVADALLHLSPKDVGELGALLDVSPPGPLVAVTRDTYQPIFSLAQTLGLTEKDA